jgi:putative ABC transport system ATP-binding protein
MSLLKIENLKKSFQQGKDKINILCGLNLELARGESLAILGKSGSGKSTLLSLLAGLDYPDFGDIVFKDKSFKNSTEEELTLLRNGSIGIVFQQFHLISHLTALENVCLPLEIQGNRKSTERALYYLNKVGLNHRLNHRPSELSGGEKQRVAIARSLVIKPDLLLADEPSGSLDDRTGDEVMDLIFNLVNEEQSSMILVTHSQSLALRCHTLWHLKNGILSNVP